MFVNLAQRENIQCGREIPETFSKKKFVQFSRKNLKCQKIKIVKKGKKHV